ncbi:MAG TPA: ABC transporter substrate-binding protein [Thermoplasmata archaeon]|jgi:iron complex transport system substrate-binding protein|nr:ABC transporter substrate-binding protein [Thermoplasmata archaeon]
MTLNPTPASRPAPARTIAPEVVVVALLIVAGVAVAGTAAYFELRPPAAHTGTGNRTISVVDDLGRRVTAPTNATRIVALAPSIMDILSRLDLASHVVGVGCQPTANGILNEYSPNQTSAWGLSASSCISDFPSLNTEELLNRSPQLVLASTITSAAAVETLTVTDGIPVILLAPSGIEGIVGDVALVAQLYPGDPAAIPLMAQLHDVLNNASTLDANLSTNGVSIPSVLLTYYFDGGGYYTYGPGTFGESLIELAGGSNVAAGVPLTYFEMNGSTVLNDEPAVIIYGTSWNDAALVSGQTPSVWTSPGGAPYWSQLNGSKYAVDVTVVTEADPTMILALPLLEHWLHPTLVPAP